MNNLGLRWKHQCCSCVSCNPEIGESEEYKEWKYPPRCSIFMDTYRDDKCLFWIKSIKKRLGGMDIAENKTYQKENGRNSW